ncbi:MAG TPA: hypothetical protein VKR58_05950 [Aquella sp.]|nr:hypothetical protein [Aquella sp.]
MSVASHLSQELIYVDINIPKLTQQIKEVLDERSATHHSIQDLKLKVLEAFGKETRRRARIILSQSSRGSAYPPGGGGTDTRYGGIRLYDTITWKVYPNQNRVRVMAGGGIRPDAFMYNKPRGEFTQMNNVSFFSFKMNRRVKYKQVQREGIYYLGGAFRGVLRDLQKIVDRVVRKEISD